ncbi:MAG: hypothetical protein R3D98_08210 [Candidatus Krumholzibacteriia bacterium]
MRVRITIGLAVATLWLLAAPLVAQEAPVSQDSVRQAVEALDAAGKQLGRAYGPFRHGVPADRAEWAQLAAVYREVGRVADQAGRLEVLARTLHETTDHDLTVSRTAFRDRLSLADSLVVAARQLAGSAWDAGLPEDLEEAAHQVTIRARRAKQLADQTAAAAGNVAYAVGVTEGVGSRALTLSVVGILVVYFVLTLIAVVVGAVRRLDDGWKQQEAVKVEDALTRAPTIDDTTAVLIAAACATVIAGRFRIRRVRRLLSPRTKRTPWSAQGRLILQGSHSVSRKS